MQDEDLDEEELEIEAEALDDETSYVCQSCGEDIVIPIDPFAGANQEYVEDCPICCHPHVLSVHIDRDGTITVTAEEE